MTLAEAMIATLKSHGVKFLFGVPGGGSSLDLIAAADQAGLHFILCRGETSAAIAAAGTFFRSSCGKVVYIFMQCLS